ncbi:MAG: GvpL/GvpF family gas vesicle protein, partial [Chloroflexi bacterium]|nr:GvpL/GvpF family gas vesicle protein [Chloroflexota bacterium]
ESYEGTRANMLAHQRVQERVMQEFTLLPVRFGTVSGGASSEQNVRRLLDSRFPEFDRLLREVEGKVEMGLKALWKDEHAIFEEIAAQDEGIRRLRDSLKGKPPNATHFERIRLGEMVKAALERKRKAQAAALLATLRPIAHRTVENPVTMDRMIVNAAFLLDKQREAELDRAVNRLDEELSQRVTLRYVGPVPPYNFVNVIVNWQEL